jgi:hypothetical protein
MTQPSDRLPVPAARASVEEPVDAAVGWQLEGPASGFVPVALDMRLIHRPAVIDAAGAMLADRLGWAFQRGSLLGSRHDPDDVRMYGKLLVPVPVAVMAEISAAPAVPRPARRRR